MIPALAIGTFWIIVGCAIAPKLGRALKHADPGEDYSPPTSVPQPDNSWMDLVSADCLRDTDPLMYDRFESIMGSESEWAL